MKIILMKQESYFPTAPIAKVVPFDIFDEDLFAGIRDAIDCETVNVKCLDIDGVDYAFFTDDEALSKDTPVPTLYIDEDTVLYGDVAIFTNINDFIVIQCIFITVNANHVDSP